MNREMSFEDLVGERCPVFARESSRGRVELSAYVGLKPIVLLFVPDLSAAECGAFVNAFAADYDHYRALDALVVALTAGTSSGGDLPFALIAEARDIFEQFKAMSQGSQAAGVMLVDRYGQVRYAQLAASCSELPAEARLAKLLLGFESLCPECGVPEEHWLAAAE